MYVNQYHLPDDWSDNEKYPDKQLESCCPEEGYVPGSSYDKIIFETWTYRSEFIDKKDCRHYMIFARCPKCGSYHIFCIPYGNIDSDDAGIHYRCEDCNYSVDMPLGQ